MACGQLQNEDFSGKIPRVPFAAGEGTNQPVFICQRGRRWSHGPEVLNDSGWRCWIPPHIPGNTWIRGSRGTPLHVASGEEPSCVGLCNFLPDVADGLSQRGGATSETVPEAFSAKVSGKRDHASVCAGHSGPVFMTPGVPLSQREAGTPGPGFWDGCVNRHLSCL